MLKHNFIKIKNARVHNLKNIDVEIPRDKFIVITGLSGSGKSSLAFDTIYAEGQRRYVESLSSYARQFIGMMNKPEVDLIEGLSPAISINQKNTSRNPRSTVGTITEIYDYLRLLFARVGVPYCPKCGKKVKKHTINEIINQVIRSFPDQNIIILAPVIKDKKGEHKNILNNIAKSGYANIRFDKNIYTTDEIQGIKIDSKKTHSIDIIISQLKISDNEECLINLTKNIKKAIDLSNGFVSILPLKRSLQEKTYSQLLACAECGINFPELEPRNFSFNSPHGACPECSGLGIKQRIDPNLILNTKLSIAQGAIKPLSYNSSANKDLTQILDAISQKYDFNINTPIKGLNEKQFSIILYGDKNKEAKFQGIIHYLEERFQTTTSDYVKKNIGQYTRNFICQSCDGKRLKPEMLAVKINNNSIYDITSKSIVQAKKILIELKNSKQSIKNQKISSQIIKEIECRLHFLSNVGLGYLTLNRPANTLSGGEAQRIRLATQIGSSLVSILYILDEPSIGLHQKDNDKLIETLKKLRDLGNTVIVVEHDEATMLSADHIIDVGPGAGEYGGEIIAQGTPEQIKRSNNSLTGQYLSGKKFIPAPKKYREGNGKKLTIFNATEHNLKNINVEFPLGKLIAITGVSGSGKSTLMTDILSRALNKKFYRAKAEPGQHKTINGVEHIDKVVNVDQSPIGRTPRSNPATYTGLFTPIRDLFASLQESKIRGYKAGHFSFNAVGGRCEACSGDGLVKIEMQFLPDVYVNCEICDGKRYNKKTLGIYYKEKNIYDVLDMTVKEAMIFFKDTPAIYQKLSTLYDVGLGYIKLGQSATTLSGGEAQRVKLATELSRKATGKTLYILDEPTTGLHFDDIKRLLAILNQLVEKGNTVLIIEHNLDIIKSVDWIIDLGPEGGDKGGEIIAEGTPREVAQVKKSWTGQYLAKIF